MIHTKAPPAGARVDSILVALKGRRRVQVYSPRGILNAMKATMPRGAGKADESSAVMTYGVDAAIRAGMTEEDCLVVVKQALEPGGSSDGRDRWSGASLREVAVSIMRFAVSHGDQTNMLADATAFLRMHYADPGAAFGDPGN
jgi:hypothetical protein